MGKKRTITESEKIEMWVMYRTGAYYQKEICDKFAIYPDEFKKIMEEMEKQEYGRL